MAKIRASIQPLLNTLNTYSQEYIKIHKWILTMKYKCTHTKYENLHLSKMK